MSNYILQSGLVAFSRSIGDLGKKSEVSHLGNLLNSLGTDDGGMMASTTTVCYRKKMIHMPLSTHTPSGLFGRDKLTRPCSTQSPIP
jgi:hypothetical protein